MVLPGWPVLLPCEVLHPQSHTDPLVVVADKPAPFQRYFKGTGSRVFEQKNSSYFTLFCVEIHTVYEGTWNTII